MFKIGDKVKTLPVSSYTEESNKFYSGRIATIESISFPYGLHMQYIIRFEKPLYDHGYKVETHYYYDFDNGLELLREEQSDECTRT